MRRYLFVGPSLPDAAQLVPSDVRVLPPVAAGDLLRLPLRSGDAVGIADGYFHQTRAVRHKEILAVLQSGVSVFGGASIGALRAAELDGFGMRGVGAIYRDFREGQLTADDEVALIHGPAENGYRAISEPLVNIRATLDVAERESIVDSGTRQRLISGFSGRSYRLRTYPALIQLARDIGLPANVIDSLQDLCINRPVNQKREDALQLVDALLSQPQAAESSPSFTLARTIFLHRWELGALGAGSGEGWVGELAILRMCQLFARDYPNFHHELVFAYLVRECRLVCGGEPNVDLMSAAIAHAVHRRVVPDVQSAEADDFDFLNQWLTPDELAREDLQSRICIFLARSCRIKPGISCDAVSLNAIREHPVVDAARQLVGAARSINEQLRQRQADFDIHDLSRDRVLDYFMQRWDADPNTIELCALDRGIESLDMLVASARPYYLLAKYNADLVEILMAALTSPDEPSRMEFGA